jgi:protein gp37
MPLNKSTGNMYDFITHTWNPVKGACPHGCAYCYMNKIYKRFNRTPAPLHLDEKELRADLGNNNFIFVGSSVDLFAQEVPDEWINKVFNKIIDYENKYLFQSKNPRRFRDWEICFAGNPGDFIIATTLETNRFYPVMGKENDTVRRLLEFYTTTIKVPRMITCEPIMDFDLEPMCALIKTANPFQVNIGADTGNNHLPEPPKEKLLELIAELEKFTKVVKKKNLNRLIAV